jgi:hypothetical protein
MVIYRGAGFLVLFLPIVFILLLLWLCPDPSVKPGDTSLSQTLLGASLGAAVNTALGFVLNRGVRRKGARAYHHFFFMPMQWPSLAIFVACGLTGLIVHLSS